MADSAAQRALLPADNKAIAMRNTNLRPIAIEQVRSLDPSTVSPSPFLDRSDEPEHSAAFRRLLKSIETCGQQVPIVVTRYGDGIVCVCGHRRLHVARVLRIKVKALVLDLDANGAALAQGLENAARLEPTFIEKARFASSLDKRGFARLNIAQILEVREPDVSRFLMVVRSIHGPVLDKIGPAPGIGRMRWQELAKAFSTRRAIRSAYIATESDAFPHLDSVKRFETILASIRGYRDSQKAKIISAPDGRLIARVGFEIDGSCIIKMTKDRAAFAAVLVEALPSLFSRSTART